MAWSLLKAMSNFKENSAVTLFCLSPAIIVDKWGEGPLNHSFEWLFSPPPVTLYSYKAKEWLSKSCRGHCVAKNFVGRSLLRSCNAVTHGWECNFVSKGLAIFQPLMTAFVLLEQQVRKKNSIQQKWQPSYNRDNLSDFKPSIHTHKYDLCTAIECSSQAMHAAHLK